MLLQRGRCEPLSGIDKEQRHTWMNSRHLRAATPLILEAVVTEAEGVSYLHLGSERRVLTLILEQLDDPLHSLKPTRYVGCFVTFLTRHQAHQEDCSILSDYLDVRAGYALCPN